VVGLDFGVNSQVDFEVGLASELFIAVGTL